MGEANKQIYRILIEAPIETVWEALTKEGEKLPFFFGTVLHTTGLEPGAPIRMRTPDGKYTGVVGDVLEFDPPHRYSHTFKFTSLDEPACKVTYELNEIEGGIEFTLTVDDVPEETKTEKYMAQGGDFIVTTLKAVAEKRRLPLKSKFILCMCWLTKPLTPKVCLTTNWPFEKRIG